jgi:glutathione S-transferase
LYKGIQKEAWFKKISPAGQIPALVDYTRTRPGDDDKKDSESQGFAIFDGAAILFYLVQNYDKESRFSFDPVKEMEEHSEMVQWVMFAVSSQPHSFFNFNFNINPFCNS